MGTRPLPGAWAALAVSLSCHPRAGSAPPEPVAEATNGAAADASKAELLAGTAAPTDPGASSEDGWGCGLPDELRARGWPKMLSDLKPGDPPPPPAGGFTLVVLPDTQYYVACQSEHLARQVRYVLDHQERHDIVLVLTVGDLTDHNSDTEWAFFHSAVAPLVDRVPLILTTGNHDHGQQGAALTRGSGLVRAFGGPPGLSRQLVAATPSDGNWENAYYRLPVGKATLGVLTLEWSPREAMVRWADEVLDRFAGDRQIFSTHAYLYHDDTRYDWERFGPLQEWNPRSYGTARLDPEREAGPGNWAIEGAYDGEMLWQRLLRTKPGLFLTLNGHVLVDGQGYLASRGDRGNLVHQMLMNFQMLVDGGAGFLGVLQVQPGGRTLRAFTYSPSLGLSATGPSHEFEVDLDPPLDL